MKKLFSTPVFILNSIATIAILMVIITNKTVILSYVILAVNLLLNYKIKKVIDCMNDDSVNIDSLIKTRTKIITYGLFVGFIIFFLLALPTRKPDVILNTFLLYLGFYFIAPFLLNFYNSDVLVIRGEIYVPADIENITINQEKHSDDIDVNIVINGKNKANFKIKEKEFSAFKKALKLERKIKY